MFSSVGRFNRKLFYIYLSLFCINNFTILDSKIINFNDKSDFKFFLNGYIKFEGFFDSRQMFGFSENQAVLFPRRKLLDKLSRDINAHPQFNMTAIETTLDLSTSFVKLNERFKAKAHIRANFIGIDNEVINLLTLINGYTQIESEHSRFIVGQFYHPLYVEDCYPKTIAYAAGAPIESLSWQPQVRVSYINTKFEIFGAFIAQRDYQSLGPCGFSTKYLSNTAMPNMHLQIRGFNNDHVFGFAADYKRLLPEIVTEKKFKTSNVVNSFIFAAYTALNFSKFSTRIKFLWAQNGTDLSMLSGYAIREIERKTCKKKYIPTTAVAAWSDSSYLYNIKKNLSLDFGLFFGYTKNLGANKKIFTSGQTGQSIIYAFDSCIDYVARVSPRVILKIDPIDFGFELEFNRAAYGKLNEYGQPQNSVPVNSLRILSAVYYVF